MSRIWGTAAMSGLLALLLPGCGPSASPESRTAAAPPSVSAENYVEPRGGPNEMPDAPPTAAPESRSANRDSASGTAKAAGQGSLVARPRLAARRSGAVRDITFDDLEFKIERDADFDRSLLTPEILALEGQKVVVRGFILASSVFQQKGIEQFVLVRDNQQCCFGPGAYIYHNIQIQMEPGKTADFSIRPVTVEGQLAIKPWIGPDGKCYSVYYMTARSVH